MTKSSKRKLLEEAGSHKENHRYDEAIECYERILEMDGMHYGALIGKGESLKELGQFQEAILVFDQAIALNEDKVSGWNGKGSSLMELGEFESAVECFQRSIRQNPEDWNTYDLLGVAFDKSHDHPSALEAFDTALELNKDNSIVYFHQGNTLSAATYHDEALHSFQQCLKIDPSYVPAYLKQAATLQTLERHEEAVTCCNTAIALNPSHELLYYTKATSLYHLQRPTDALASVNKALSLNSGNAPRAASAHLLRAKILTQLHLVSHAILACQQAINLVQNDHERNQAQSLLDELQSADQSESVATDNNNDDDNAIDVNIIEGADDPADLAPSSSSSSSSSTSSNNPDQPFSLELMLGKRKSTKKSSTRKLYKQANDLLAEGHFDQAIEHFDQILEMDGMHYGALIGKGESYKELGHYQQAINVFEQAISVNEDKVSGWNGKGAALLELGDFQSAVECLHRSIRQNPEDWSTYDLLGVALDKMKDHSAALDAFESSLELNQDNSLVWFHKAECLFSLMNYEESLHSYDEAIRLNPDFSEALENRLDALRHVGTEMMDKRLASVDEERRKAGTEYKELKAQLKEHTKAKVAMEKMRGMYSAMPEALANVNREIIIWEQKIDDLKKRKSTVEDQLYQLDKKIDAIEAQREEAQRLQRQSIRGPNVDPALLGKSVDAILEGDETLPQCKAKAAYSSFNTAELHFEKGDIITILSQNTDVEGWWMGELDGKQGKFPAMYVKKIRSDILGPQSSSALARRKSSTSRKTPPPVSFNDGFALISVPTDNASTSSSTSDTSTKPNNKQVGKHRAGPSQSQSESVSSPKVTSSSDPSKVKIDGVEVSLADLPKAKARSTYTSFNLNELHFEKGDVITIVSKKTELRDWWIGELNGKRGTFPKMYVREIPGSGSVELPSHGGPESPSVVDHDTRVTPTNNNLQSILGDIYGPGQQRGGTKPPKPKRKAPRMPDDLRRSIHYFDWDWEKEKKKYEEAERRLSERKQSGLAVDTTEQLKLSDLVAQDEQDEQAEAASNAISQQATDDQPSDVPVIVVSVEPEPQAPVKRSAQEWLTEAEKQMESKQFVDAIMSYTNALGEDEQLRKAWFGLGLALIQEKRGDEAVQCFEKCIQLDASDSSVYRPMAEAYRQSGELEAALTSINWTISNERNPTDLLLRVDILHDMGELQKAIQECEEVIQQFPESDYAFVMLNKLQRALENNRSAQEWVKLGLAHKKAGEYKEALHCYSEAVNKDPQATYAWFTYAMALRETGQWQQAVDCFQRCIELYPEKPTPYKQQAIAYRELGQDENALESIKGAIAVETDPHNLDNFNMQIDILCDLKRWTAAIEVVQQKIAQIGETAELKELLSDLKTAGMTSDDWFKAGMGHKKNGELEEAIRCFNHAVTLNHESTFAWFSLGVALNECNKFREAVSCFDRCITLYGNNPQPHLNQAVSYRGLGQFEAALDCVDNAIDLGSTSMETYLLRVDILEDLGDYEESIEECKDTIDDFPEASEPVDRLQRLLKSMEENRTAQEWVTLGLAHKKAGEMMDALRCYSQAVHKDPEATYAWFSWGMALKETKRFENAIECFQRCILLHPHKTMPYKQKALTFRAMSKPDEAMDTIEVAVQLDQDNADLQLIRLQILLEDLHDRELALQECERMMGQFPDWEPLVAYRQSEHFRSAQEWFRAGLAHKKEGELDMARQCYERSVAMDPTATAAWFSLGMVLNELELYPRAIESFQRCVQLFPSNWHPYKNLAIAYRAQGQFVKALEAINAAIGLNKPKPETLVLRLDILSDMGDLEQAIRYCKELIDQYPDFEEGPVLLEQFNDEFNDLKPILADRKYKEGMQLVEQRKYVGAIKSFDQALALNPKHASSWYDRGLAHLNLKKYHEAIDSFESCLAIDPDRFLAWHSIGSALSNLKQYTQSLDCYDKAIAINPEFFGAYHNKSISLKHMQHHKEAIVCCDEALRLNPTYEYSHRNKAMSLFALGREEEALESINRALELNPKLVSGLVFRAEVLHKMDKIEEAIQNCEEALALKPKNAEAIKLRRDLKIELQEKVEREERADKLFKEGLEHKKKGEHQEALHCYEHAIELNREATYVWFSYGVLLNEMARYVDAIEAFDRCLELYPDNAHPHKNQAVAYRALGELEAALESVQIANHFDGGGTETSLLRSEILLDLKRVDEALEVCEHVLEAEPDNQQGLELMERIKEQRLDVIRERIREEEIEEERREEEEEEEESVEQYGRGLDLISEVLALNPTADGYFLQARTMFQLGAIDEAIAACRQCLELDPEHQYAAQLMVAIENGESVPMSPSKSWMSPTPKKNDSTVRRMPF